MFADKNNHLIKQIFSGTKRRHGGDVVKETQEDKLEGNEVEEKEDETTASLGKKSYDDILPQYLFKNWTSQKLTDETTIHVCAYNSDGNFVKYIVETRDKKAFFPSFVFTPSQKGGFLDGESSDDPLDKSFESEVLKFANGFYSNTQSVGGGDLTKASALSTTNEEVERSNMQTTTPQDKSSTPQDKSVLQQSNSLNKDLSLTDTLSSSSSKYIGYLNINNSIYAFVKVISSTSLIDVYTETILNELFHTFKVFDDDVDDSVRTLFENNAWLLIKDEPFSGYLCDLDDQDKQMKNVKKAEPVELTNVESIGDFYYFSFLPLDKENAKLYQRYAFFPGEYVCILDENQLEEYKKDKMSYAEDKSIYFKGDILAAKKQGHEFFAVKTPSQFTQY